jgi:ketosteroid isomerase-like protein
MATGKEANDLGQVVEEYHLALGEFMKGNHEPAEHLYSRADDITLGNPFGPFARGREEISQRMQSAASHYRGGGVRGFDRVAEYVTPDLACIVEVEHLTSKVGGREDIAPVDLRVTSIFRREEGGWRLVHRHADPITTVQQAESVVQKS